MNPRVGGFVNVLRLCWPFKWQKSGSFFCHPNLCWFLQPEVTGIYLPSAGTLGCAVWPGAGNAHFQGILPLHPITTPAFPTPHFLSTPFCDSVPPTQLDECIFFKSLDFYHLHYNHMFLPFLVELKTLLSLRSSLILLLKI